MLFLDFLRRPPPRSSLLGGAGTVKEGALLLFEGAGTEEAAVEGAALLLKDAGAVVNGACGRVRRKKDPIELCNNLSAGISILVGDYPLSRKTRCSVESLVML